MAKSGWCIAPRGARPQHTECRWKGCTCECHKFRKVETVELPDD